MSSPETPSHLEELAALDALDLLDAQSRQELELAIARDPALAQLARDYVEIAALIAHAAPDVKPRDGLRGEILRQLPSRANHSKIIPFHQWVPYAIAACLMALGISQSLQIKGLKGELVSSENDAYHLRSSNALIGLRLATLEAKDASYNGSKILVAWDPYQHRGVVSMQALPAPPAGHDYQLWVLDPGAAAPISAGLITDSRSFAVQPVSTPAVGFAISLEPSGGQPEPTGPILFAVAPGP
jgi:anti-sigma-K factor RskA